LYEHKLRALNVPLKYEVKSICGAYVEMRENAAYGKFFDALLYCLELFNPCLTAHKKYHVNTQV
jgi:hypothetical protein